MERDKLTTTVDKDDGFVVDICSELPNLSEVTHELSAVKFELTKLHSLLQQKERELTEVRVNSENVAVAANLENSKQVGLDVFLYSYIHTEPIWFAIPKVIYVQVGFCFESAILIGYKQVGVFCYVDLNIMLTFQKFKVVKRTILKVETQKTKSNAVFGKKKKFGRSA